MTAFLSTHAALKFAFNFTGGLPPTPHARLIGGRSNLAGLTGFDGAGQAGMVLAELHECGPGVEHVITARYAPRMESCDCGAGCCRGWRDTLAWGIAVMWLTQQAMSHLSGRVSNYRLREAIVRRYFGERETMSGIASYALAHRDTVSDQNTILCAWLRVEEAAALLRIDERLKERGMVPSRANAVPEQATG
jgi:hypothetical protein